ncbi:MAG: hypothetical protein A2821_03185 [Candidatus Magasanikbacteria bacterium RIFCSPHIGHO2_01_FULL_41_23]|uniref:alanine--tRNA ligase n=1 Tax=Candidatus Magasanikbacteria bacterium RIFCSPLOWO2_01_FULL_40_15 TaxID=1798686 RepID=A0A1F6N1T3_9BACT|nr:MAG: hypothetical protein A2821_03185 [Candidatus Magasanikbacteria bacterium RIFCSPHIGHO2_01_FULL_41_23]OGH76459.1 MAG: hypothetical protein A3F22_03175 [Candidatus Magasanikbacteria bacterium RIFCSPHIGHO2_12_FULL_41_16]OGH77945.1 MAG: hypothetical protein A2983_01210 [Candidatus Magasanikbacteria bacterium RIFCSPLOWO2_01_FULL_40_15]
MLGSHEIRARYLNFFQKENHVIIPSSSLLPENDPTTLFTGSGMQPMVPYLLGESHSLGVRIVDSQKCFRSQDIEEVGDNRHTTFFEMLGNWSLGDYFKTEQISWMFEFLTNPEIGLGLDARRLYFTCFRGNQEIGIPQDTDSAELWQKLLQEKNIDAKIVDWSERDGMQAGRIFYYDEKKNWWSRAGIPGKMPVGEPGGPDTEMFWDFNPECGENHLDGATDIVKFGNVCHVNCDCGRFLEIGNNVFMQYHRTESGFELLPQTNVDFGGGLERLAAAVRNDADVFNIDLFDGMKAVLEQASGQRYADYVPEITKSFRVILDHLRAAAFLIADNAIPSNKDQGYFTRRLIRRSIRYAHMLGIQKNFCAAIAEETIKTYASAYPQLIEQKKLIISELEKEETKFKRTIEHGIKKFNEITKLMPANSAIPTEEIFDLYQSYGFSLEITQELATEKNLVVNETEFRTYLKQHQDQSRAGSEQKFKGGLADHSEMSVKYHTATHLLHAAVLKILGAHAVQKGSNITPERLRFDFAHGDKLTAEQIKAVEDLVNAAIARDYSVTFQIIPVAEAKAKKAIGLFAGKYEEMVKVYTVGDPEGLPDANSTAPTFSREFCGGPHVEHTGIIGHFKIVKEEAVSAGVRRIKAIVE